MQTSTKHPDLFTPNEAAEYLHVTPAQIETLEKDYGLIGFKVGRAKVYFRRDLDRTVYSIVGLKPPPELERQKGLRMAN